MTTTFISEDRLKGDGPGATPVTITIEGRDLVLPRCLLIDLLNVAHNAAYDRRRALLEKPLGRFIGDLKNMDLAEMTLQNAAEELHCFGERMDTCDAITAHIRSQP